MKGRWRIKRFLRSDRKGQCRSQERLLLESMGRKMKLKLMKFREWRSSLEHRKRNWGWASDSSTHRENFNTWTYKIRVVIRTRIYKLKGIRCTYLQHKFEEGLLKMGDTSSGEMQSIIRKQASRKMTPFQEMCLVSPTQSFKLCVQLSCTEKKKLH